MKITITVMARFQQTVLNFITAHVMTMALAIPAKLLLQIILMENSQFWTP